MQSAAKALLMEVQSIPPAPAHPPQLSTLDWTSTHSWESSKPGIGHFVYGNSQSTSRRTRRERPDAAIVLAVAARVYISLLK